MYVYITKYFSDFLISHFCRYSPIYTICTCYGSLKYWKLPGNILLYVTNFFLSIFCFTLELLSFWAPHLFVCYFCYFLFVLFCSSLYFHFFLNILPYILLLYHSLHIFNYFSLKTFSVSWTPENTDTQLKDLKYNIVSPVLL